MAEAFATALLCSYDGVFNIGSGEATPVRNVVESLGRITGRPDLLDIGAIPAPPGEPPLLVADVGILKDRIGFTPAVSLEEGLAETYAWWRSVKG